MIRFKVIKLKKNIFVFAVGIILIILLFFLKANWNFPSKPAFSQTDQVIVKNNQKNVPIFRRLRKSIVKEKNKFENINIKLFKKMITLSLPAINISNNGNSRTLSLPSMANKILYSMTNIDFFMPESIFCIEIPMTKLIKTEMTMTPGVEIMPGDKIEQISDIPVKEDLYSDIEKIKKLDNKKPLVLIFHTHTTESYTPSKKYNYKLKDDSYHTEDLNFTVAKVGEYLAGELNKLGISTMHNKTVHDVPTYMTSYGNSLKTVRKILKENPSIKVVIDLHRDAPVKSVKKSREITTVNIDGDTFSRIMFVVGSDKNFPHPHWKENHRFCMLLHKKLEERYPGISRGLDVRTERFNQHLSKKAILLEMGSHGNTMEESIETAKIFAKVLAETLKEISAEDID